VTTTPIRPTRTPTAFIDVTALAHGVKFRLPVTREVLPALRKLLPPGSRLIADRRAPSGWTARGGGLCARWLDHGRARKAFRNHCGRA
jgi:hypothetical protein